MTVTVERMNQALKYLAETDEVCAALRSEHARSEFFAKSIKDTIFASLEGSVADRQAKANTSETHKKAKDAEFDAFCKYEAMKNKRATESIVIDTWRSLNAARNKGQII